MPHGQIDLQEIPLEPCKNGILLTTCWLTTSASPFLLRQAIRCTTPAEPVAGFLPVAFWRGPKRKRQDKRSHFGRTLTFSHTHTQWHKLSEAKGKRPIAIATTCLGRSPTMSQRETHGESQTEWKPRILFTHRIRGGCSSKRKPESITKKGTFVRSKSTGAST